jgi:hypothetical protein
MRLGQVIVPQQELGGAGAEQSIAFFGSSFAASPKVSLAALKSPALMALHPPARAC